MAMRVKLTADCDVHVKSETGAVRAVIAYSAGMEAIVPDDHASQIVAAGAGKIVEDKTPAKARK